MLWSYNLGRCNSRDAQRQEERDAHPHWTSRRGLGFWSQSGIIYIGTSGTAPLEPKKSNPLVWEENQ